MQTFLGQSSSVFNSDLGEFVNDDHVHLAQVLQDLKPTYTLVYVPQKDRTTPEEKQKPWAILDKPDNLPPNRTVIAAANPPSMCQRQWYL